MPLAWQSRGGPSQASCTMRPCGTFTLHQVSCIRQCLIFIHAWLPHGMPDAPPASDLVAMLQDDLESLAYTLLEVCHGSLPWCLTAGKEFEEGHDWYSARQLHAMAIERIQVGNQAPPCLRVCCSIAWQWSMHTGVGPDPHSPQLHHLLTTGMPNAEQLHGE